MVYEPICAVACVIICAMTAIQALSCLWLFQHVDTHQWHCGAINWTHLLLLLLPASHDSPTHSPTIHHHSPTIKPPFTSKSTHHLPTNQPTIHQRSTNHRPTINPPSTNHPKLFWRTIDQPLTNKSTNLEPTIYRRQPHHSPTLHQPFLFTLSLLKDLAVLAATIERLVRNEADMLLNVTQPQGESILWLCCYMVRLFGWLHEWLLLVI